MLTLLKKYLASHKGTITSVTGVVVSAFFGTLYSQAQNGGKFDYRAATGSVVISIFGLLAAYGKSPATPFQDPPLPEKPSTEDSSANAGVSG